MMNADVTHQSKVCRKSSSVMSRNRRVGGPADIVDQNVDAAEALHGGVDDTLTVRTAYRVRDKRQPLAAGLLDARHRADDFRLGTCGPDNRCTGLRQHPGNARADATTGACDDRDLSIQSELLQSHAGLLLIKCDVCTAQSKRLS